MKSLFLILALSVSTYAQNITVAGPFSGLNNANSSITIENGEAQDTLNVEVSKDAMSLNKRKGYSLLYSLTTATESIRGSVSFKSSAGDNIKLFAHDSYLSASKNGGAFTNIYTTAPVSGRWSFCISDGKAYAFNSSTYSFTPFSYDGTSLTYYPSFPKAPLCAMTVDRMLLAGTTDYPNRFYFSKSGAITNFTVGVNPEDAGFEDIGLPGEKITNIFTTQSEWLVFKTNSMTSYQGSNQFDLVPSVISEKIGMLEPYAIVQHEGIVYFKSTNGKFYGYTSGTVNEISKKISGIVDGITKDQVNTSEYTTNSQFETGTFYNTTSSSTAGSIEPLAYSYVDDVTADFSRGSVSSVTIGTDEVSINNFNSTFPNIGFEMGNITNWSAFNGASFGAVSSPFSIEYGTYSLHSTYNSVIGGKTAWISPVGDDYSATSAVWKAYVNAYDSKDYYSINMSTQPNVPYYLYFWYSNAGIKSVPFTTTAIIKMAIHPTNGSGADFDFVDGIDLTSGTFTSQVSTITAPVPHQGYLIATSSLPTIGTYTPSIDYFVRSSSAVGGPFTSWAATTNYLLLSGTTNQYWQYKANFYNTSSYLKPTIYSAGLTFKSTGYWETPEQSMGGMNSWGLFNADSTLDPAASYTYKIYVSTFAGGTATATAESLTPGALITASTGTYSKIRATNNFTTATETVRMDGLSFSWSRTPDKMANAFEYKGDIYFGVPYNNSLSNNRLLKFDTKTAGWNVFDIAENSPLSIDEDVYFGSPTGGYVYQYPVGDSDNGSTINSYWKSKNYIGTNPYVEKSFDRISLIAGSDYGSSIDVTYTMDTATSTTYTVDLTSSTANFVRNNRSLPIGEIGTFFNLQIGNNAANQPWSFYGANIEYKDDPWRVIP